MNPYQKALNKKKFEGLKIEISPMDTEEQDANNGTAAPEVKDDEEYDMEDQPAEGGEMESDVPIDDESAEEYLKNNRDVPDIKNMSSEEIFGAPAPEKALTLREKAMKVLKGKK